MVAPQLARYLRTICFTLGCFLITSYNRLKIPRSVWQSCLVKRHKSWKRILPYTNFSYSWRCNQPQRGVFPEAQPENEDSLLTLTIFAAGRVPTHDFSARCSSVSVGQGPKNCACVSLMTEPEYA